MLSILSLLYFLEIQNLSSFSLSSYNNRPEPASDQIKLRPQNLDDIKQDTTYIYAVDENNNLIVAERGSTGKSGTKHTQLTEGKPAKAAGELRSTNEGIQINNQSGRFRRQSPEAIKQVKSFLETALHQAVNIVDKVL